VVSRWKLALLPLLASAACASGSSPDVTFGDHGGRSTAALLAQFYTGAGTWYSCAGGCGGHNLDWGDDSLTFALYLRWSSSKDPDLVPIFAALASTAASHAPCGGPGCGEWSDVPEWDAIADEREYEVTGDPRALGLSKQAYASVRDSDAYALGACPSIRYQQAFGGGGGLKTLETDSNAIKAALLLWKATGAQSYLDDAATVYAAVRRYFLDPVLPLYTVYVYDDGVSCAQLPARFFASANGNMIWNGVALASATGDPGYLGDAMQTARAVDQSLSDGQGVFVDLQAENDVVEPLIEGFYALAVDAQVGGARAWILKNAQAAIAAAQTADGLFGRFFDGPAPTAPVTAWQANGGVAIAIAAAALAPNDVVPGGAGWSGATSFEREITTLPSSLAFDGSGVALFGTLGERCCEPGHASVAIDGQTTVDQTGIWQNKSTAGRAFEDTILFAWRWPTSGAHVLDFGPSTTNVKEGGPFLHVRRYVVLP
jgi:hypothetical protein